MFLGNLGVAPACGAVELEHQRTFGAPDLVHTVLITVEREQAPIAFESKRRRGIEHHVGGQPCERHHGVDI
jgi:hypothetical protein